jgi:hypothetical protein
LSVDALSRNLVGFLEEDEDFGSDVLEQEDQPGITALPMKSNATNETMSQLHFEGNVRLPFTLPKMGLGSPPRLPKTQNTIAGVKTPRFEAFFIPLKSSWSVDVQNGLT